MCGISGVMLDKEGDVGPVIIEMLSGIQHRGYDSAGVAIYGGLDLDDDEYLLTVESTGSGAEAVREALDHVESLDIVFEDGDRSIVNVTARYPSFDQLRVAVEGLNALDGVHVLSAGHYRNMKDVGSVEHLDEVYDISSMTGTHAIGHTRFSTESGVDCYHAHPFQSYVREDITVVHNGQITNYWNTRDRLERKGHRFDTDNDTECIVHFVADMLNEGHSLQDALEASVEAMDGPFSYIISTPEGIGIAKDQLGLRPAVVGETDGVRAIASEEASLRAALGTDADIEHLGPGEVRAFMRTEVIA